MALPKQLHQLNQKLDALAAKLGIDSTDPDWFEPLRWQKAPAPPAPPPPTPDEVAAALDYDSYSAKEIIERAASLTPPQRKALLAYERSHAARKTVLEALS
jgi:hypothetical protein